MTALYGDYSGAYVRYRTCVRMNGELPPIVAQVWAWICHRQVSQSARQALLASRQSKRDKKIFLNTLVW
ncbi:MAG: hypothetical protein Q7U12_18265 [Undibacterium sp.]|jgi:hypothetical protein|nr:hypothetical protein [Undibacterium sp.]